MCVIIVALFSQLPRLTIDTSTEGFLHKDDPALVAYDAFREQFGRDEVIIVAIESPNVFDLNFLTKLNAFHEDLEEHVPYIDDITSMVNARNTRGEEDELIVEDLLEHWPESETELAALKDRVMTNESYKNWLISENGRFTTIIIKTESYSFAASSQSPSGEPSFLTDEENSEAVLAVQNIIPTYQSDDFKISLAGSPVVMHFLKEAMMGDIRKFMGFAILTVALFLFVMFRRISGMLLPLIIVLLSLLSTLGLMAMLGVSIKVPSQILPSFLLAVGVGTSVHILAIFFQRLNECSDKEAAIVYALGHSGLAVVMTNMTTASGLLSFSGADVAPIADVGTFAGIGVILAFLYTLVLLPALLAILPIKAKSTQKATQKQTLMDRLLNGIGHISTEYPYTILMISAIILVLSVFSMLTIRFTHFPLGWFPEDNPIRLATEKIDQELRGSLNLEVVIDTGEENGLYDPDFLNRMEQAVTELETMEDDDLFIGKAWSVSTILKEINRALNENRSTFYTIPQDRTLIAQELLLFEMSGSDDLEDVVDNQFSMARFTIKVPFKDAIKYHSFLQKMQLYFEKNFPETRIVFTGMMGLLAQTFGNSIKTMAESYVTALVVITLLMIVLIGRLRIGLLSMIPNLFPILLMLGLIGACSFPLDLFTMMIASIAIGLAVDDTIHFMHNFRRYYEQSGDPKIGVHQTLQTTGRAMLVTSVVLSLGFFNYTFATLNNIINFGLLTSFTILMALVADYFITPALMVIVNRKEKVVPQKVPAW